MFAVLTASHRGDIPIPGRALTLGALTDAVALGDLRRLRELGRRTVHIDLGDDPVTRIDELSAAVEKLS